MIDNLHQDFVFSHKFAPFLLMIEVVTMTRDAYYRSFLIYAWDVLFWLS